LHPGYDLIEVAPAEVILDLKANNIRVSEELRAEGPTLRPRWEPEARRLLYDEIVCRDFSRRRAPSQMAIVEAFHGADWESPIRAPFTEKTLRDNIRNLNKDLEPGSPIEFSPSGPERMAWRRR
jgi:hypothetical protein